MRNDYISLGQMAARDEELRQTMLKIQQQSGGTVAQSAGTFDLTPSGTWPIGGNTGYIIGKHGVMDTVTTFIPGQTYFLKFRVEQFTNVGGVITVLRRIKLEQVEDINSEERAAGVVTRQIGPFEQNISLGLLRLFSYDQQGSLIAANPDINSDIPDASVRQLSDYLITWNSTNSQAVSNTNNTAFQLITNGKFSKQDTNPTTKVTIPGQLQQWFRRDSSTWATASGVTTTNTDPLYWKQNERAVYWISNTYRLAQPIGRSYDNSEFLSFSFFVTCGTTFAPTVTPRLRDNLGADILDAAYVIPIPLAADTTEHYIAVTLKIDATVTINKRVHFSLETSSALSSTNFMRIRKVCGVRGKEPTPWFSESLPVADGNGWFITDGGGVKRLLEGSGEDEINGVVLPVLDLGVSPFDPDVTGTQQGFRDFRVF